MENKTIDEWESEKEIMNSGPTGKDRFEEIRTYPAGSQMTLEEPAIFGVETEPTEEEEDADIETGQVPESDGRTGC